MNRDVFCVDNTHSLFFLSSLFRYFKFVDDETSETSENQYCLLLKSVFILFLSLYASDIKIEMCVFIIFHYKTLLDMK